MWWQLCEVSNTLVARLFVSFAGYLSICPLVGLVLLCLVHIRQKRQSNHSKALFASGYCAARALLSGLDHFEIKVVRDRHARNNCFDTQKRMLFLREKCFGSSSLPSIVEALFAAAHAIISLEKSCLDKAINNLSALLCYLLGFVMPLCMLGLILFLSSILPILALFCIVLASCIIAITLFVCIALCIRRVRAGRLILFFLDTYKASQENEDARNTIEAAIPVSLPPLLIGCLLSPILYFVWFFARLYLPSLAYK